MMLSPFSPKTKQTTKNPCLLLLLSFSLRKTKQTNSPTERKAKAHNPQNPQALSLVQFLTAQFFFYLVRKQNKEIEDHTKMQLHSTSLFC
jgi:hypothetical protein